LKRVPNLSSTEMKAQRDKCGGRILLGDNRRRGGHAAANHVPVFWSLDFNWTPSCTHIQLWYVHSIRNCAKFNLRLAFRNASTSLSGNEPTAVWYTNRQCYQYPQVFVVFLCLLGGTSSIHTSSSYNDNIPPNSHLLKYRFVSHVATPHLCIETTSLNEISGYQRAVVWIFAPLGCCAASVRYRRFGILYRSHNQGSWPLKIGPIWCPETSVKSQCTPRNNVEVQRS